MKNIELLRKFKEKQEPKLSKSSLWQYKDEIKELLEDSYTIKQIYEYLRDYRQIKLKEITVYKFIQRNKDKILNTQTSIEQTTQPVKEEPKQQPKLSTPQPKPAIKEPEQEAQTTTPKLQEQKQYKDRTEEYKRYKEIYKISKVTSEYKKLLSKNEFEKAMNILQEVQNLDFAEIENGISGKYDDRETAKLIVTYMAFVITALNNKEKDPRKSLKGHTPKLWRNLMGSGNVFQNVLGSD